MMIYVSYIKTIITTVSVDTAKLSLNTTETRLSHEISIIKVLFIMNYVSHFKSITNHSHNITKLLLLYLVIFCEKKFTREKASFQLKMYLKGREILEKTSISLKIFKNF
jgi:hypothetical protein